STASCRPVICPSCSWSGRLLIIALKPSAAKRSKSCRAGIPVTAKLGVMKVTVSMAHDSERWAPVAANRLSTEDYGLHSTAGQWPLARLVEKNTKVRARTLFRENPYRLVHPHWK